MAAINQRAVYDCVYLTLAVTCQCQMVTADEKFLTSPANPVVKSLCWIENLP
jgi:predicted nucleic acid-binding protein